MSSISVSANSVSARRLSSRCASWARFHARNVILTGEKFKDGYVNKREQHGWGHDIPRNCEILVRVIKSLGKLAHGVGSELRVVDIPDDVKWEIQDFDGMERVREKSRSWG